MAPPPSRRGAGNAARDSVREYRAYIALIYVGLVGFILDRMVAGVASVVTRGTSAN